MTNILQMPKGVLKDTNLTPKGIKLDTIAQPVHTPKIGTLKGLQSRAKHQYLSKGLAKKLSQLPNSPLNKGYRRTLFDCGQTIVQEGKYLRSGYCKGRWCSTCNNMRTAKLTEAYKKSLQDMVEPYFVTLTIPNVTSDMLRLSIKQMIKNATLTVKNRRRVTKIDGIRKLECTYNQEENTYHPHFHFIVDGEENAKYLVDTWLDRYPDARRWSQDIRRADENTLVELFKYQTKLLSKSKKDGYNLIVDALDTIFQSMETIRTFQPFGKIRMVKKAEDIEEIQTIEYPELEFKETAVYRWRDSDWYDMVTNEPLSRYKPSENFKKLVDEKIIFLPLKI